MGCVTCSPLMEGVGVGAVHEAQAAQSGPGAAAEEHDSWTDMALPEPNTLAADPLQLDPEPFINTVYHNLRNNAHLPFLTDAEDGRTYSFGDLLKRSAQWAEWLRLRGLAPGSIVAISSENNFDSFALALGTWFCGAITNPFNFNFSANDIRTMFRCTEPDLIYCSVKLPTVEKAVLDLGREVTIVTPGGVEPHVDSNVVPSTDITKFQPFHVHDSSRHVVSVLFTSGTTGIPKGIQIVDKTLKVLPRRAEFGNRLMVTSPMFWISNLAGYCYSLYAMNHVIIPKSGWKPRDALETIHTYKPEAWFTGHSLLLELTQMPYLEDYDLSSLQRVMTGGTLLMAHQRREINHKIFNNRIHINHLYGSTEVGIITNWTDAIDVNTDEYNSVGTLEQGIIAKVMSPEGRQLGPRQEGELWVKSEALSPGYVTLRRQIINTVDDNGWYHMGDLVYYDEKKLIYVVGRIKDILKFRGVQIAPAEIEQVLDEHPEVVESCVVGKFNVIDGDIPVAFVVLKDDPTISVADLHEYSKNNLAEIKQPHEIHILEKLPKSAVGKILRNELEAMLK